MAAPTYSGGAAGSAKASASLAAGASTTFNVDLSTVFEGRLQIGATFGTVATTAGLKVEVFERVGSTPVTDTVAGAGSFTLAASSSTSQARTIHLQTGFYTIKLTNLDATNGLTNVYCTMDTTPTVA